MYHLQSFQQAYEIVILSCFFSMFCCLAESSLSLSLLPSLRIINVKCASFSVEVCSSVWKSERKPKERRVYYEK